MTEPPKRFAVFLNSEEERIEVYTQAGRVHLGILIPAEGGEARVALNAAAALQLSAALLAAAKDINKEEGEC